MDNSMNTDTSYERLDALIERGRQARSDTIRAAFASVSVKHLLARFGRRLPETRDAVPGPAGSTPV